MVMNKGMNTGRTDNPLRLKGQRRVIAGPAHECRDDACRSNRLRERVGRWLAGESAERLPEHVFKQAATEAEALAWSTPYPLLFLPGLMEEKVHGARRWQRKQREIWEQQQAWGIAA